MVSGSAKEIGGELTSNPVVRKLSFTGSTEIGKELMAQCAGTVKKVSLELGGNAPFIVFDDAGLDAADVRWAGRTDMVRFAGVHDALPQLHSPASVTEVDLVADFSTPTRPCHDDRDAVQLSLEEVVVGQIEHTISEQDLHDCF